MVVKEKVKVRKVNENSRKYVGEKSDITKAKEVCERYRGIIPHTVTHADVYVAINT